MKPRSAAVMSALVFATACGDDAITDPPLPFGFSARITGSVEVELEGTNQFSTLSRVEIDPAGNSVTNILLSDSLPPVHAIFFSFESAAPAPGSYRIRGPSIGVPGEPLAFLGAFLKLQPNGGSRVYFADDGTMTLRVTPTNVRGTFTFRAARWIDFPSPDSVPPGTVLGPDDLQTGTAPITVTGRFDALKG